MIHAIVSFVILFFELLGAWVRHELGAADYRIVRLVFFSSFAALFALHVRNIALHILNRFARMVVFYTPLYPELFLILGLIKREEYDRYSYGVFRAAWRVIRPVWIAASSWGSKQYQFFFTVK
ncbi:hypothetical protein WDW37_09285 [Bdellovibrionota bacterium FG-1]